MTTRVFFVKCHCQTFDAALSCDRKRCELAERSLTNGGITWRLLSGTPALSKNGRTVQEELLDVDDGLLE